MIVEIDDNKRIDDIQEQFSNFFGFLKMEFYKHPHHWAEKVMDKTAFPSNMKIGDIRKNHIHGNLKIYSWQKTGAVEQEFRKHYGLNVEILRQHGDSWVQTVGTDDLTLEEQNEIGKKASEQTLQQSGKEQQTGNK